MSNLPSSHPEDGGGMYLRNVGNTAQNPYGAKTTAQSTSKINHGESQQSYLIFHQK
jgi:hypothetical protein